MSKWLLAIFLTVIGGTFLVTEVEARRLGGGRAIGTQRSVTAPPAKPAQQQQAAPANQQPQQAAPQGSRWGGILGGLALGGLLGYLFAGNGMGGILLLALLAIGAVFLIRALARRRTAEAPRPMQFAGMRGETVMTPLPAQGSALQPQAARSNVPSGFDVAGFLKGAKRNFVKLQLANDAGELEEIREFTTQDLFVELSKDVQARGAQSQHTDIVSVDADLLEVATENDRHWASVRFSGMVRETPGSEPVGFEEVWNLVKPADGSSGWLLAGIQQMH